MGAAQRHPTIGCPQEPVFSFKDTNRLKMKRLKKIFHTNVNQKRSGGSCNAIRQNRL